AELREWIAANTNPFAPTRSTSSRTSRARHWPCMVLRNGWPGLKHSPRRRGSCRERSSLWLWLPERTRRISSRHRPGKDRLQQREVSPAASSSRSLASSSRRVAAGFDGGPSDDGLFAGDGNTTAHTDARPRAAAILDGPGRQQDEPVAGGGVDLEGVDRIASPIWGEATASAQRRTQSAC